MGGRAAWAGEEEIDDEPAGRSFGMPPAKRPPSPPAILLLLLLASAPVLLLLLPEARGIADADVLADAGAEERGEDRSLVTVFFNLVPFCIDFNRSLGAPDGGPPEVKLLLDPFSAGAGGGGGGGGGGPAITCFSFTIERRL